MSFVNGWLSCTLFCVLSSLVVSDTYGENAQDVNDTDGNYITISTEGQDDKSNTYQMSSAGQIELIIGLCLLFLIACICIFIGGYIMHTRAREIEELQRKLSIHEQKVSMVTQTVTPADLEVEVNFDDNKNVALTIELNQ